MLISGAGNDSFRGANQETVDHHAESRLQSGRRGNRIILAIPLSGRKGLLSEERRLVQKHVGPDQPNSDLFCLLTKDVRVIQVEITRR